MKLLPDPYGHEQRYDAAKRKLEIASNIKPADKQATLGFSRELLLNKFVYILVSHHLNAGIGKNFLQ